MTCQPGFRAITAASSALNTCASGRLSSARDLKSADITRRSCSEADASNSSSPVLATTLKSGRLSPTPLRRKRDRFDLCGRRTSLRTTIATRKTTAKVRSDACSKKASNMLLATPMPLRSDPFYTYSISAQPRKWQFAPAAADVRFAPMSDIQAPLLLKQKQTPSLSKRSADFHLLQFARMRLQPPRQITDHRVLLWLVVDFVK